MHYALNIASALATMIVWTGVVHFLLNTVMGKLAALNRSLAYGIRVKDISFFIVAIAILFAFAELHYPW